MPTVADLGGSARHLLAGSGLPVDLGALVVRMQVADSRMQDEFLHCYAFHRVAGPDEVADFTFGLAKVGMLRPMGRLLLDGRPWRDDFRWKYGWGMFEWGLHIAVARRAAFALVLHAAVVVRDGRALVLPARSGSGKSTLCAVLVGSGWEFYSDEFLVVARSPEGLRILPLRQSLALKGASCPVAEPYFPRDAWSGSWPHERRGFVRYARPPRSTPTPSASPGWILLPRYEAGAPTSLTPVPRREAFLALGPHTFTYHWRGADGFRDAAALVRGSACATLVSGSADEQVAAVDEWTRGS